MSESSQVCQDYYSMSKEMEAQCDLGVKATARHLLANTLHLQPTSKLQAHYQFKRTQRLFGLEASVLISSLTVYLLRRNLTRGHV